MMDFIEVASGVSWLNDELDGWIDAEKTQPPLLPGQDSSANVWGWDGSNIMIVSFFVYEDGWHWANAYGDVWGDAEFDDDYDIKFWQPIAIPLPPNAKANRARLEVFEMNKVLKFEECANYRGELQINQDNGKFFWRVSCDLDDQPWHEIHEKLFRELEKHYANQRNGRTYWGTDDAV